MTHLTAHCQLYSTHYLTVGSSLRNISERTFLFNHYSDKHIFIHRHRHRNRDKNGTLNRISKKQSHYYNRWDAFVNIKNSEK